MSATDDVVFVWAIGKALVIVLVALGILLYAAWAGTRMIDSSGKQKPR